MKKIHSHVIVAFLISAIFIVASDVCAEEIRFEATVSRNVVALGQSIQLNLAFEGTKDVSAPELPAVDGFQSRYTGPSTMMSIVNGRMSSSITHIYRLIPLKTGKFSVGPFSFQQNGNTYVSNGLVIEVIDASSVQAPSPHGQSKEERTLRDRLFLTIETEKRKLYINEPLSLTIKLYNGGLNIRDIQYPEFSAEGFSTGQFGKPTQYQENRGGVIYDVIEFTTEIFGTKVGAFSLGPATLQTNLALKRDRRGRGSPFDGFFGRDPFDGFFGGYRTEPIELSSGTLDLSVVPLPEEGRPSGFTGALGDYTFQVEASPREVKAGDPVTLKMTVSGKGNFTTVQSLSLPASKDFKVYEPQTKQEGNRKVFEQVIIPLHDAVHAIPAVAFTFFDTGAEEYRTILRGPFPLSVAKPETSQVATIIEAAGTSQRTIVKEDFGRDIIYIKGSPGPLRKKGAYLYNNGVFLLLQTLPLLLLVASWIVQKRRERLATDIGYARRLSAPRKARKGIREAGRLLEKNQPVAFYNAVYKTLREYIGDRFHIPSGGITADVIDTELKEKDVDAKVLGQLQTIFRECDMARYAPSELAPDAMENTFAALKEVIDHLERSKG